MAGNPINREQEFFVRYLRMAFEIAQLSRCKRSKVGALLIKDGNILSFGYNGTPRKTDNCCEHLDENNELVTKPDVIHAESNCIAKAAQSTISVTGATLICTVAPCFNCSIQIENCGIVQVIYGSIYRNMEGVEFLSDRGLDTQMIDCSL